MQPIDAGPLLAALYTVVDDLYRTHVAPRRPRRPLLGGCVVVLAAGSDRSSWIGAGLPPLQLTICTLRPQGKGGG